MDIILGNERGKWHLFKNNFKTHNYIVIEVGQSPSSGTGLGALVEVNSCGNVQYRRVGSTSASYSQGYNDRIHFGLGACNENVKIIVTWTDGNILEQRANKVNTTAFIGKANK
jgi:hypothetical protein